MEFNVDYLKNVALRLDEQYRQHLDAGFKIQGAIQLCKQLLNDAGALATGVGPKGPTGPPVDPL